MDSAIFEQTESMLDLLQSKVGARLALGSLKRGLSSMLDPRKAGSYEETGLLLWTDSIL